MMVLMGLPMLVMNCGAVLSPASDRTLLFGSFAVSPAGITLLIWIAIPMLFAMSLGQGFGKLDFWGKDAIPAFFAVRPMTTPQFIALKLVAAAISAIVCWAIIVLFLTIWAFVEASPLNPHPSLVRSTITDLTFRNLSLGCLMLLGLIAATWRTIVIGMWPSLAGRKWLSMTLGVAIFGQLTIAVLAGGWIYRHPEVQAHLVPALPWFLGALLVLKLGGAAAAAVALQKLRLTRARTTGHILGCWLAAVAGILAVASYLTLVDWQDAAVAALCVPLVRILAAPIALYINRHR
jgi:hypothetical protein